MTTPAVTATAIEEAKTELAGLADPLIEEAKALTITNATGSARATTIGLELKSRRKRIVERLADMKISAHKVHQDICALEREGIQPIDGAIRILDRAVIAYDDKVEREALERRRKEEAKERARLEKEKEKELEAALDKGDEDLAEEIVNEAPEAPKLAPMPTLATRTGGQKIAKTYKGRVTNVKLACRSIAEGKLAPKVVQFRDGDLNALARLNEGRNAPPGIEFYSSKSVARGGRG